MNSDDRSEREGTEPVAGWERTWILETVSTPIGTNSHLSVGAYYSNRVWVEEAREV